VLPLAAFLTGFGGLLLQFAWLRRYGLLLGNTAAAAAQVLGVFLAGLGAGGLLAARWRAVQGRPLASAARGYLAVALVAFAAEPVLRSFATLPPGVAQAALSVVPGLPALAMGVAFPLLFAGLRPHAGSVATGALAASNLAGAVAGAFLGGNFLVPDLGLLRCGQLAGLCYLVAAAVLVWAAREGAREAAVGWSLPAPVLPRVAMADLGLAFGAGVLLLGSEVFWLRRLPFFLEGFQPTLSGVVASVLLWSAVGAAVLTPLLQRAFGQQAAVVAALAALASSSIGLHEWAVPAIARLPVASTAGMHARVGLGATAVAALPCAFLGAIVPLLLVRAVHRETRGAVAGALFGAQGLGELMGALLSGHALPLVAPSAYFAVAPAALGVAVLCAWRRALGGLATVIGLAVVAALAWLGVSGAGTPWAPRPPARGARYDRPLEYRYLTHAVDATATASVAYNRRAHSLVLFTDEFRATETGPNTAYMRALGHLPFLLREGIRHAAVIALGTGATLEAVVAWPDPERIDAVEVSRAVIEVAGAFTGAGPVPDGGTPRWAADPRVHLHVADGRAFLARCAPHTLDLVTMEPLLPYAPGTPALYSSEFYLLVRHALAERGLLVQWLPTHALPRPMFDALLATIGQTFPHVSVWLIDHSTLVVASTVPHVVGEDAVGARLAAVSEPLRARLHDTGLVVPSDLVASLVCADAATAVAGGRVLTDDAPFLERLEYWSGGQRLSFLPDNLLRLAELVAAESASGQSAWRELRLRRLSGLRNLAQAALPDPGAGALPRAVLDFDAARVRAGDSVLLHREQAKALRTLYDHEIAQSVDLGRARAVAERALRLDGRSALALAVLAAAATDAGTRERRAQEALALDPLLWATLPPVVGSLGLRADFVSPREDLGRLPEGEALVRAACGEGAWPVALRGTFGPRVGRALVALARRRALVAAENGALLPVLDPFLWQGLVAGVVARGGDLVREALPMWRRDLAAVPLLAAIVEGGPQARIALGEQLGGRGDAAACELLALLLSDADADVRRSAARALARTAGGRIPYDPEGPESERAAAAAAVRRLHNPPP